MYVRCVLSVLLWVATRVSVEGRGMLLLYRPRDISNDCAYSNKLRYDLTFGMGLSDTITLVLRDIENHDYECQIEIVTERYEKTGVILIVVIRYPNQVALNCRLNPAAFIVLRKDECFVLCSTISEEDSFAMYYAMISTTRFRFHFTSNSSINEDMNANMYQVTATSARPKGKNESCHRINETMCTLDDQDYCFTSGVVCDGIKNCGADDWYDERKSQCSMSEDRLGVAPMFAVASMVMCGLILTAHILKKILPAINTSFFVFNTDADNRMRLDALLTAKESAKFRNSETVTRQSSIIPIYSSDSSEDEVNDQLLPVPSGVGPDDYGYDSMQSSFQDEARGKSKSTLEKVSKQVSTIKHRLRSVTARSRSVAWNSGSSSELSSETRRTTGRRSMDDDSDGVPGDHDRDRWRHQPVLPTSRQPSQSHQRLTLFRIVQTNIGKIQEL